MRLNIGNLEKKETNILGMPRDNYMPFLGILQTIYLIIGNFIILLFLVKKSRIFLLSN